MTEMTILWERTGEHRPPMAGEWFDSPNQGQIQARFDFAATSFDILRQRVVPLSSVAHCGDPCKYCGVAHDNVPVGPCPARVSEEEPNDG